MAKVRRELESVGEFPQQDTRTGKDGKTYKARKPIRYTLADDKLELWFRLQPCFSHLSSI